ncbi:MAG: biotin/lipoyl-containing protein [Thermoanaerobaculia bacterium]
MRSPGDRPVSISSWRSSRSPRASRSARSSTTWSQGCWSRYASTPRIRSAASLLRPGGSSGCDCRRDPACATTGSTAVPEISIHYDPMIAKLIVWGQGPGGVAAPARRALDELRIVGIKTNVPLFEALLGNDDFRAARFDIHWLDRNLESGALRLPVDAEEGPRRGGDRGGDRCLVVLPSRRASARGPRTSRPLACRGATRRASRRGGILTVQLVARFAGRSERLEVTRLPQRPATGCASRARARRRHPFARSVRDLRSSSRREPRDGSLPPRDGSYAVGWRGRSFDVELVDPLSPPGGRGVAVGAARQMTVTAYMPGRVVDIRVAEGEAVEAGQSLVVLEAMKMQNEIQADRAGT